MDLRRKAAQSICKIFRLGSATNFSCSVAELMEPVYKITKADKEYVISCPNNITRWRAETFFTKEPETISWIDTFKDGDVLFDIGANIGLYTIYAAKNGTRVFAFEPDALNYALLNRNVYLNSCAEKATCLNIALSDKNCLDYLYLSCFKPGSAMNCLAGTTDWDNKHFQSVFKQGVIVHTLDFFLHTYADIFPTHIKIDVDGLEPNIIAGAAKTLEDGRLKTVAIEINEGLKVHVETAGTIERHGFRLLRKGQAEMFKNGPYQKCFNYLFVRK